MSEPVRPLDPFADLQRAVDRAISRHQAQVSVNPHTVLRLLKMLEDKLAEEAEVKIEHRHVRLNLDNDPQSYFEHAHKRGDIPHGHHGARYVQEDRRPVIEI